MRLREPDRLHLEAEPGGVDGGRHDVVARRWRLR